MSTEKQPSNSNPAEAAPPPPSPHSAWLGFQAQRSGALQTLHMETGRARATVIEKQSELAQLEDRVRGGDIPDESQDDANRATQSLKDGIKLKEEKLDIWSGWLERWMRDVADRSRELKISYARGLQGAGTRVQYLLGEWKGYAKEVEKLEEATGVWGGQIQTENGS